MSDVVMKRRPHGFFSECHHTIVRLSNSFKSLQRTSPGSFPKLDSTDGFFLYKTEKELSESSDIWSEFFNPGKSEPGFEFTGDIYPLHPTNLLYKADFTRKTELLNTPNMKALFKYFFTPSANITNMYKKYCANYSDDHDNICYIYYRGNDKLNKESLDVPLETYITAIENKMTPGTRIVVQTDVYDFYENIKKRFNNTLMFDETWVGVNSSKTIHRAIHKDLSHSADIKDNIFALLGSLYFGAQCRDIISNTSGFSLFLQLYRCLFFDKLGNSDDILYTRDPKLIEWENKLPQYR